MFKAQDKTLLVYKGAALQRLNRHEEAIDIYNRVLDVDPKSEVSKKGLLASYEALGDKEKVLEVLAQLREEAKPWVINEYRER